VIERLERAAVFGETLALVRPEIARLSVVGTADVTPPPFANSPKEQSGLDPLMYGARAHWVS
jgi:hypothetical protein